MPITVHRIPETPVIIARLSREITSDTMEEMSLLSVEAAYGIEGMAFRIIDATDTAADFDQLYTVIRAANRSVPGSATDSRFRPIFVGRSRWIQFARHFMQQKQIDIPLFLTVENAITYIHMQLQARTE